MHIVNSHHNCAKVVFIHWHSLAPCVRFWLTHDWFVRGTEPFDQWLALAHTENIKNVWTKKHTQKTHTKSGEAPLWSTNDRHKAMMMMMMRFCANSSNASMHYKYITRTHIKWQSSSTRTAPSLAANNIDQWQRWWWWLCLWWWWEMTPTLFLSRSLSDGIYCSAKLSSFEHKTQRHAYTTHKTKHTEKLKGMAWRRQCFPYIRILYARGASGKIHY